MTIKINGDNSVANPGFTGADTDTGLQVGTDELKLVTGGTARATVDSSGNVGIGTTSPQAPLSFGATAGTAGTANKIRIYDSAPNIYGFGVSANQFDYISDGSHVFYTSNGGGSPAEKARIDSSGRLLVGTSSAYGQNYLQIQGDQTNGSTGFGGISLRRGVAPSSIGDGSQLGFIDFGPNDGGVGARIAAWGDAQNGTSDYPSRLVFSTTADGASSATERMRIDSTGSLLIGTTSQNPGLGNTGTGFQAASDAFIAVSRSSATPCFLNRNTSIGTLVDFRYNGSTKGSITTNGTVVAYNTSSDYRLKENIVDLDGAITRVKQLQPRQFNFIESPSKTVDGFIAHEAQTVVPEAVTGTKDEVDDDGNAVMQGIDQSKLVPLLTAALQEAIAKIETLETQNADLTARITALETA